MQPLVHAESQQTPSTQKLLARGQRLTELLKQAQYSPLATEEQVCVIYAGVKGYLDKVPVAKVKEFESALLRELNGPQKAILDDIVKPQKLSDGTEAKLKTVIESLAKRFG